MSIQAFGYNYNPTRSLVDENGVPVRDGRDFLLALFNRSGGATGIIPKANDPFATPIIATGASIADAVMLVHDWNWVGTVAAGTGVQILPLKPGNDIEVYNGGANALHIYPPDAASQIDALGNGAAFILNSGKLRIFQCWTLNQFFSLGN